MRHVPLWRVPPENAAKLPLHAFPIAAIATIIAVSVFGWGFVSFNGLLFGKDALWETVMGALGFYLMLSFIYSWAGFVVAFPIGIVARAKGYIGLLCVRAACTLPALLLGVLTFLSDGNPKEPYLSSIFTAGVLLLTFLIFAIPFWLILYFFWPKAFEKQLS